MSTIARYFDASKDDNSVITGVPKADIDQGEWDGYPEWLQRSVDAHPMYRKTAVRGSTQDKKEGD